MTTVYIKLYAPISSAINSLKETPDLVIQLSFVVDHTGIINEHKKVTV